MFGSAKNRPADSVPPGLMEHRVVALRCALRSFAALGGLANNPVHPQGQESEALYIATLRGIVVAWASQLYPPAESAGREATKQLVEAIAAFDVKLETHYEHWRGFHDAMIGSIFNDLDRARRVSGLVGLALGAEVSVSPSDSSFPEDPFSTSAFPIGDQNWRAWTGHNRAAVEADLAALSAGAKAAELVQSRLWSEPSQEALSVKMASLRWWQLTLYHWLPQQVDAWVRERTPGALVLGGPAEAAEARFRRILSLPEAFWQGRGAEDVADGLAYALSGDLDNPHWGEVRPSWLRLSREKAEAERQKDLAELSGYRRSAEPG